MKKYKWGILATGRIANDFARGLAVLPDASTYAVASRDINKAKDFAAKYGCEKAYGSYQELYDDPDIDIIYIGTPNTHHEEAAVKSLERGKAVLCEKPFAVNARQTERIIQCARKNNLFLMEAAWTRFLPVLCKTRELIKEGAIGKVRHVNSDFGFMANINPEHRLFNPALAGGSLLDVGVYNIYLCSMVFGKQPVDVHSKMTIGSTGVDEECSIKFDYDEGESAFLFSALRLRTPLSAYIFGTEGHIEIPIFWKGSSLKLVKREKVEEFNLSYMATGYQYEAQEVMECIEKGLKESPIMPLDESLTNIKMVDRIRRDNNLRFPADEE